MTAALVGAGSANAASLGTWDKVAQCESSGQWDIVDVVGGVTYYGGLQFEQFDKGTWEAYGGTAYAPYADQATKQQQILIAEKVLAKQGEGAWPQCGPKSGLGADTADPYPETVLHYSQTAAADFTGDGKADIIARDDSTGNLMMWVHNAGASYYAPKVVSGGWNFSGTTGDFNGDAKADTSRRARTATGTSRLLCQVKAFIGATPSSLSAKPVPSPPGRAAGPSAGHRSGGGCRRRRCGRPRP